MLARTSIANRACSPCVASAIRMRSLLLLMNSTMDQEFRVKHVAIVGSGSSALGALWALGHSQHRVYLYEAEDRLGGHANAVCFRNERNGKSCMVDTAFMMVNDTTYREEANPIGSPHTAKLPSELYGRLG
jgi:NADPH-dependent 2,4-dienoyl-CoA reductase/sulfur reductase-like enzyme